MRPDPQNREGRPAPAKAKATSVSTAIKNIISLAAVCDSPVDLRAVVIPW